MSETKELRGWEGKLVDCSCCASKLVVSQASQLPFFECHWKYFTASVRSMRSYARPRIAFPLTSNVSRCAFIFCFHISPIAVQSVAPNSSGMIQPKNPALCIKGK